MVIRLFSILAFCFFNLSASDWYSYDDAIKLQKQNSKIIMVDVVRTHCQYCVKMQKSVFDDKDMQKWLQDRFIMVKINLDVDKMPLDVDVKMTPTFYFINNDDKIIKVIPGSWNIKDFKDLTKKLKKR